MSKFITKHVDSSVWIGAFMPDKKDRRDGIDKLCLGFLDNVLQNESNTRLRMCFPALGEILLKYMWANDADRDPKGMEKLKSYVASAGSRIEPYSPKLVGLGEYLHEAIATLRDSCENMHKANADNTILSYAAIDQEAVSLYTLDGHMLQCPALGDALRTFRKKYEMPQLKIKYVA